MKVIDVKENNSNSSGISGKWEFSKFKHLYND
ncbi:hypothetical protein QOZ91_001389 [Clostridium sardiniense]|nr:hypothetical protein [Clostridium sardiniense]